MYTQCYDENTEKPKELWGWYCDGTYVDSRCTNALCSGLIAFA